MVHRSDPVANVVKVDLLRQRARPYLFSNSLPPAVVAAGLEALKIVAAGDDLRARLTAIDPAYELSAIGHLADGNLHLTVTGDGELTDPDPVYLAVEAGLKASGGSISAEHGIGLAKIGSLSRNASGGALDLMRAVKAAMDPKGILNPGKVVPG